MKLDARGKDGQVALLWYGWYVHWYKTLRLGGGICRLHTNMCNVTYVTLMHDQYLQDHYRSLEGTSVWGLLDTQPPLSTFFPRFFPEREEGDTP